MSIHRHPPEEQWEFWLAKAKEAAIETVEALQELRKLGLPDPTEALTRAFDHAGDAYDDVVRLARAPKGPPPAPPPPAEPAAGPGPAPSTKRPTGPQLRELRAMKDKWRWSGGHATVLLHRNLFRLGWARQTTDGRSDYAEITPAGKAVLEKENARKEAQKKARPPGDPYQGWVKVIKNL